MAHYAFLDTNNIVTEVIVGKDETEFIEGLDPETWYGNFRGQTCKRTSYNTYKNVNIRGGIAFRKNYACIGHTYDEPRDAFIPPKLEGFGDLNEKTCTWIPPKPFPSWILNEETCIWNPPTPMPTDEKQYIWDEATTSWLEM